MECAGAAGQDRDLSVVDGVDKISTSSEEKPVRVVVYVGDPMRSATLLLSSVAELVFQIINQDSIDHGVTIYKINSGVTRT